LGIGIVVAVLLLFQYFNLVLPVVPMLAAYLAGFFFTLLLLHFESKRKEHREKISLQEQNARDTSCPRRGQIAVFWTGRKAPVEVMMSAAIEKMKQRS
jgi:hypothetical protein